MILVMNRKITLDVLAVMIQEGFLDMARRMQSLEERLQVLEFRVEMLEKRMDSFEKRMDALEERMENGFYNVAQELKQIRILIKQVDAREQVAALEVRVDAIEKEIAP